jgi:hypothetical protein
VARKPKLFEPTPIDRTHFLRTIELGLPKETAAAAVGWTKQQLGSLMVHDKELCMDVEKFSARAEIVLYKKMMETGQADWRCLQGSLERLHPERYARPEVQAQLAASKIDSSALVEGIKEWLTIAEQRHSGITIDELRSQTQANPTIDQIEDTPPEKPDVE